MTKTLIFAHRGANKVAAENTRSAFEKALEYSIPRSSRHEARPPRARHPHFACLIDEAPFPDGKEKGEFLKAFGADIFFDDLQKHCKSARQHVATGHLPHGVANE